MRNHQLKAAVVRCVAWLLAAGLTVSALADARLDDLKKRKGELDQLAAQCATMQDPQKADCLAARQKKVDKYKADLAAYKSDVNKASSAEETQDYQTAVTLREKSIKEFLDYLSGCTEKSTSCASALFQAATLSYQKEEYIFLSEQAKYESDMQKWEDHDRRGPEPVSPKRNHAASLQLIQRFLKEYPNNKEVPDVLKLASFITDMQGNDEQSFEYLSKLVAGWPNHPAAVKAHLRLGDYWFLKREYAKAVEHFNAVPLDDGNDAALALYRRAETYYNMASYEEAARWFFEYIVRADAGKIKGDARDEAMSFMATSWADMDNGFETASKFLAEHGNPSWEKDVYYQIGLKNKAHDRLDESVKAFRFLLQKDPAYVNAPAADMAIVEILILQKKPDEAQKARMELSNRYAPGSDWYRKNAGNKEAVAAADKAVHLALYQIPVYYHAKSEAGDSDQALLVKAEEGYRAYLNRFPDEVSWDVYQVHQNLAGIYTKRKDNIKAATEWRWCVSADSSKLGPLPKDKKNLISRQDAGYNAVLMMDDARRDALAGVYHNDTAAAFNGPETKAYFEYVQWYSGLFGSSPVIAELAYNAAILNYEAKRFDDAIKPLSDLIAKFPDHPRVVLIRRALAQCMLEGGKYDDAAKQFVILQNKLCPYDSQCAGIKKSLASTMYKQAEGQRNSHDYAAAVQQFLNIASRHEEGISDKALFDAGVTADSGGKPDEGARYLLRIPQEYPNSTLKVKALLRAASIYMTAQKYRDAADVFLRLQRDYPTDSLAGVHAIGWAADAYTKAQSVRQAAQTYEMSFRLYPNHVKTPGYLYNAGLIYDSLKAYGDAIAVYQLLYQNYPTNEYSSEAMFTVPQLLEKQGDKARAAEAYRDFAAKYPGDKTKVMQALLSAGKNYEASGDEKQALENYEKCMALQKNSTGVPPAMASEAAYRAGDFYYKKVAAVRLDGTKAQNDGRTKSMTDNLIPAIQSYAQAVQFAEEEWALRATLRMGDLFSTIAIITDNQRVAGLSGEDRFRVAIASKSSVPNYLDKAKDIYKKNLDVGLSQNIDNVWIDSTGDRLLSAFLFKGRALEELGQLYLQVPLPTEADGVSAEDLAQARAQLKSAADEKKAAAVENYREALNIAQTYYLNNPTRSRILTRLRELAPDSPELQLQVPAKPRGNAKPG
jgi:tetratricopeptide (TPR) repeat protein